MSTERKRYGCCSPTDEALIKKASRKEGYYQICDCDFKRLVELACQLTAERQRAEQAEARLREIEKPGKMGARYKLLEELAAPMGYTGLEAKPVELFVQERIKQAEARNAELTERVKVLEEKCSIENERKIEAFNLMLTCPNPVVRALAERYFEGTGNLYEFLKYLREHPIPEIDNPPAKGAEK